MMILWTVSSKSGWNFTKRAYSKRADFKKNHVKKSSRSKKLMTFFLLGVPVLTWFNLFPYYLKRISCIRIFFAFGRTMARLLRVHRTYFLFFSGVYTLFSLYFFSFFSLPPYNISFDVETVHSPPHASSQKGKIWPPFKDVFLYGRRPQNRRAKEEKRKKSYKK